MITYCGEITSEIIKQTKDIDMIKSNYTIEGVETIIRDVGHDNQEYIMTIKPRERGNYNEK